VSSLFVIQGRDQGNRFEFNAQRLPLTLGRDAACAIQLHDTEVSRMHAEIRSIDGRPVLVDLKSSNGTFVNNRQIERHDLASGDQVQIGRTVMLFTGTEGSSIGDLNQRIRIVPQQAADNSRIVRTMRQEEGTEIFSPSFDQTQSNWLARARSNLQVMYRTALAVSHTLDIDELLRRIMQLIFEWVEADRGCIMLVDPESKQLRPRVRRDRKSDGSASDTSPDHINISRTILDYVLEQREGVLTSDAQEDQRFDSAQSIVRQGIREAICVPMQGRYDIVGIVYIDTLVPASRVITRGAKKFTEEHLKLMVAIGHQAALAVEDTNYYSAMVQAERLAAVGQTIATLSHHVKNILQGIRGGSYLIEMGLNEHDESLVRKGWDIVEKNQKRISSLVLDMLTFSKEREPDLSPGDLNSTIIEVIELMQARAAEKQVELTCQFARNIPTLIFDPEGIHRATLNIVTNAIDACADNAEHGRPAGVVSVTTSYLPDPPMAQIAVADNGGGIAPEDLADIFSLFVSRKGSRGTGLGLPVSQKIVKEHGGRIHAESQLGQGTLFTIELPAVEPDPPPDGGIGARETWEGAPVGDIDE
jgi:signal transduction histidine kinase/pSer/pThr/pTyr-binding forkhead associated (FHA) protein